MGGIGAVRCDAVVVAKNQSINQSNAAARTHPTVHVLLYIGYYPLHGIGTHSTFFLLYFSLILIPSLHDSSWQERAVCHQQTYIHTISLSLPILFCTLCTYIVYIHSLSLSRRFWRDLGGEGIYYFCLFL